MRTGSKPALLTAMTLALSLVAPARAGQELVSLTMVERAGAERQAEWVTIGVPLPKGRVKSVEDLSLAQEGRPLAADILPVNCWWEDGTLRWVHLIFPARCPANGQATVTLTLGGPTARQDEALHLTESEDRVVVDTGPLVFAVRKKGFNLTFQAGIFLEGMRRYYEMSGDQEALDYIRQSCDRLIAGNKKGGVTAQAHSFLYRKTGDSKYLQAALDNLPQEGQFGNPGKDFALAMRNAAMCLGDLHRIAQKQTAIKEAP